MTRVTGLRWPLSAYLSGGRGIHSLGSRFWLTGPPRVISSFASFSFDSSSITCPEFAALQENTFKINYKKGKYVWLSRSSFSFYLTYYLNLCSWLFWFFCTVFSCNVTNCSQDCNLHKHSLRKKNTPQTFFCNLMTEVHFFSKRPAYFLSSSSFCTGTRGYQTQRKPIKVMSSA